MQETYWYKDKEIQSDVIDTNQVCFLIVLGLIGINCGGFLIGLGNKMLIS